MLSNPHFDAGLLRRYDRPGPRYTSYPTAPQFSLDFGEHALREAARLSNGDPIPRLLSIYVHVPFCLSPCFYCACNRIITRDRARAETYLARLYREIDLAATMFDRDREAIQVHFGGGTPNFLSPSQLREVVDTLRRHFHFSTHRDRDLSIELDPRSELLVREAGRELLRLLVMLRGAVALDEPNGGPEMAPKPPGGSGRPGGAVTRLDPPTLAILTFWEAQHALAQDVALDLAGAGRDRVLARRHQPVEPAGRVGHELGALVDDRVHAEQLGGRVRDAHAQLGAG